jgi:hypothetical protein
MRRSLLPKIETPSKYPFKHLTYISTRSSGLGKNGNSDGAIIAIFSITLTTTFQLRLMAMKLIASRMSGCLSHEWGAKAF